MRVAGGRTSSRGQRASWPERRQATVLRVKTRIVPWAASAWSWNTSIRQSNYDQTADISFGVGPQGDKLRDEIVRATDRIGSITSHNLFGNLFYDFINTSRFTPYIGVGGGVGFTDMEYGSVWARADDPAAISTGGQRYEYTTNEDGERISTPIGEPLPNALQIQQKLAKTVSVGQATLSDVLLGFQVLFGVDYAVTEATSLGLKGRWVRFGSFSDDFIWNPLRTHAPNLRLDGSEPVSGRFKTERRRIFRRQREPEVPF